MTQFIKDLNPRERSIFTFLLLAGLFFSCAFLVTQYVHYDNLQILEKVVKLLKTGEWTHYGNRGSGVGFVPGSFLTAIAAAPMAIYFSPFSAASVILIFHLISLFLLTDIGRKISTANILVYLTLFYWLNPWRVEQSELYNPGYLFLFSSIHLWSSYKMTEKNFWLTFAQVVAIGFCAQVHFSAIILVFLSLILLWKRYLKVHWWGFTAGTLFILLTLLPYLIDYASNSSIHIDVAKSEKYFFGRNLIYIYPVLKAITYWIRYSSTYFGGHIFSKIYFDWIDINFLKMTVHHLFHSVKWVFAALTFFLSTKWNWQLWKRVQFQKPFSKNTDRTETTGQQRFELYFFYLFIAMLIAAALSPTEFTHWHLILCFPACSLFLSLQVQNLMKSFSQRLKKISLITVTLFFLVLNTFAFLGSHFHSYKNNFHRDFLEHLKKTTTKKI